jgi:hypothetical protein
LKEGIGGYESRPKERYLYGIQLYHIMIFFSPDIRRARRKGFEILQGY